MSVFSADRSDEKTPVFVLTGFLGSGKTTLLNRLLRDPALADTAVIVNELGDVALDHLLVQRLEGEVAMLQSGCICCALRSDFESTLRELLARRDDGELAFRRVVIETTGLADPAPLLQAVDSNPLLAHFVALGAVLTTVDAVHGLSQLERQWEARKQVALADTLVVTKTDLAPDPAPLLAALQSLNPQAAFALAASRPAAAELLRPRGARSTADQLRALAAGTRPLGRAHGDVGTLVLEAEGPLDWPRLQQWLAELRERQGDRLLRLKGIVRVDGEPDPLVLHGVHHLFHPPVRQPALDWPAQRSVLVLIGRGLDAAGLRAAFESRVRGPGAV